MHISAPLKGRHINFQSLLNIILLNLEKESHAYCFCNVNSRNEHHRLFCADCGEADDTHSARGVMERGKFLLKHRGKDEHLKYTHTGLS